MLAEVCLKGDQILEEVPMFYIDFSNFRDLELTVTRNKYLGVIQDMDNDTEVHKKARVALKKKGVVYGNMVLERHKFNRSKTIKLNDNHQVVTYLSTRISKTEFQVVDMENNPALIEFRPSIRDILIKSKNLSKDDKNRRNQHHHEFYFYEIYQWDLKDEYCCIYFNTGGKKHKYEFRIEEKNDLMLTGEESALEIFRKNYF